MGLKILTDIIRGRRKFINPLSHHIRLCAFLFRLTDSCWVEKYTSGQKAIVMKSGYWSGRLTCMNSVFKRIHTEKWLEEKNACFYIRAMPEYLEYTSFHLSLLSHLHLFVQCSFLSKTYIETFLYLDITKDKITNVSLKGDCFLFRLKLKALTCKRNMLQTESQNNHDSDFWFIKLYSICS